VAAGNARALGQLALLARPGHRPRLDADQGLRRVPAQRPAAGVRLVREFELLVERGVKTGSFDDYTFIWWDLRPHPKLGTIELRVCDGQTRLENVAGLVALTQSLVATLADRYERDGALPIQPRTLIDENKWRAARYGLETELIDLERDEVRPAREAALTLVELAEPAARRLGCEDELVEIERLCARGGGAEEQRRVEEEQGSLLAVAKWLAEETVGTM